MDSRGEGTESEMSGSEAGRRPHELIHGLSPPTICKKDRYRSPSPPNIGMLNMAGSDPPQCDLPVLDDRQRDAVTPGTP